MFINKQHQLNYEKVSRKWKSVEHGDKEYIAAGYILALPMIFEKVDYRNMHSIVQWIVDWEFKYNDTTAEKYDLTQEEREEIEIGYDLTSSMRKLGQLAWHLWNSYDDMHLLDCLASLDKDHYKAALTAIRLRLEGKEVLDSV